MNIDTSFIMEFPEEINKENAEFLVSLSHTEFSKLVWKPGDEKEFNKGERFRKKEPYVAAAIRYLKTALSDDCVLPVKYNYSEKMRTDGRLFSQGFTLQSMKKNLRAFLASDKYNDYDIKNAHFCILATLLGEALGMEEFAQRFPNIHYLTRSEKNRQKLYDKCDMTKHDALIMLNSKFETTIDNDKAHMFDNECKKVQNFFWDETPEQLREYEHFKPDKRTKNKKGSFLNRLLCIYENKIINEVVKFYSEKYPENNPVSTLMFDGLYISKELPDQCEILNNLFHDEDEYSLIKFDIKPPDDDIEKSDLYINRGELPKYENRDYNVVKKKFEEEYFMILNPVMFVRETTLGGKPMVCIYNQQDFKIICKPIKYEVFRNGRMEEVSILDKWIADPTRRHYKKLDFIPSWIDNPEIYNTFTGFDYGTKDVSFTYNDRLIIAFKKQVSILTDHDDASIEWLIRWVADIFQNPDRLPGVCPLLKSGQGWGKDTLVDIISKLLNKKYIFRTAKPEDVFGHFNPCIQNKLILQLNELEGKDGFMNKEKLKNLITEATTKINQKNMKEYDQSNYLRIIICTNNNNPIEIPSGDRRFVVFDADPIKPQLEHFDELRILMDNEDALYSLYQYLMEYDLGDISLRNCRPITRAYKEMREKSTPPFYVWLNDELKYYERTETYQGVFTEKHWIHKKSNNMLVKTTDLFELFKEYMELTQQEMYKFNAKMMKDYLSRLKIYSKHTKINGSSKRAYWIDMTVTLGIFDTMGLNDTSIEVYDSDDELIFG